MTYNDFYNQYKGQSNVGNTAANRGQCVGLVSLWMDNFGITHVWGDAKDLYANASDKDFAKIVNDPTAIPQQGDIIVWSGAFNGGVGHTGIASGKADVNTFECFEQNDPIGSTPHLKTYNYSYVTGWLRAKSPVTDAISVPKVDFERLVTNSTQRDNIADKYSFDKSGSIDTLTFEKVNELEKTKQQIQTALDSCTTSLQTSLNQAASVPPSGIPDDSMGSNGSGSPTYNVGNDTTVPSGDSTTTGDGSPSNSGDSPEVVPTEAQGFEFLALIYSYTLGKIKSFWKAVME